MKHGGWKRISIDTHGALGHPTTIVVEIQAQASRIAETVAYSNSGPSHDGINVRVELYLMEARLARTVTALCETALKL